MERKFREGMYELIHCGKKGTRLRICGKIILFAVIFYAAEFVVFCLTGTEISSWSRRILNQMYTDSPIEIGVIGGSQVLYGISPSVMQERLGKASANLTSSQQPLSATDAVLRETAAHHPEMKEVYVSLDYSLVMADEVNLESIYMMADAMPASWNKVRFLLHATPQEYYLNSFLPLRKGESYSFSRQQIVQNLAVLKEPDYRFQASAGGYAPHDGMTQAAYDALAEEYQSKKESLPEENGKVVLPDRSVWAIRDMISFCKKRDIHLTFLATPVPEFVTESVTNYDGYVQAVRDLLDESDVEYLDFNQDRKCEAKQNYDETRQGCLFDRKNPSLFNDDFHLSGTGAEIFTESLCSWLQTNG